MDALQDIPYTELETEIITFLDKTDVLVLSTSMNDHVTSRSMSFVNEGLRLYFQTDTTFLKAKQIEANPSVAVCAANFQFEGKAYQIGHPLDAKNRSFLELFKKRHLGSYRAYSHLDTELVYRIDISKATVWKYLEGNPYRYMLLVNEKRACLERYL